jgi:hypothetical protein
LSSKKIEKIRKILRGLERQRQKIVSELLCYDELLRGSFATVYTKCGKDTCWCKDGKGHPHSRLTWNEEGQGYTRKVPKDEIPWILEATEHYRQFRLLRRRLKELEARSKSILDQLEEQTVERTRKPKLYLGKKV